MTTIEARGDQDELPRKDRIAAGRAAADALDYRRTRRPPATPAATQQATVDTVEVQVAHGDLAFVRDDPIAVGHYLDDTIVGAERALDRRLDGRLSELRRLALYPGDVETHQIVLAADRDAGGAVVVGLGEVGGLTPGRLGRSFAKAALGYVVKLAEDARREGGEEGRVSARLTSLLIGSGGGGLSLEDSITAIVEGVLQANHALRDTGLADRAQIERLQFLEIYQDLAVQAAHLLRRLADDARFASLISTERLLQSLPGGRRRITFEEDPGWWQRLQIVRKDDDSLSFTALTDRARAEDSLQPTQRALVDGFIDDAVHTAGHDLELAGTLFELLVPNHLKQYAPDQRDLVLVLDEHSARYPWELLHDRSRGEARPLAVRAGLIRQLKTRDFRPQVLTTPEAQALVVGDPPSDFAELPAAQKEAERVANLLKDSGFDVTARVRKGFREVARALYAHPYRVLHLAGHGVYELELQAAAAGAEESGRGIDEPALEAAGDGPGGSGVDEPTVQAAEVGSGGSGRSDEPAPHGTGRESRGSGRKLKVTGMVLGRGVFLTPKEIEQMRHVPELVFINCCFLGYIEGAARRSHHRLAANLATQLIRMGVRAVVAAGWAVNDDAALTFAETFYGAMLGGTSFGEAILVARQTTFREHPDVNTWGAYQCYGDPGYVLRPGGGKSHGEELTFVAIDEAVVELENLARQAAAAPSTDTAWLRDRLAQIEEAVDSTWRSRADLSVALGRVRTELGQFEAAVADYERALESDGDCTVEDLEQLADLRCRWAAELARSGAAAAPSKRDPAAMVRRGIEELESLPGPAATAERLMLLGSAHKRLSAVTAGPESEEALVAMRDLHQRAHRRALERRDPAPLLDWLAARVVLRYRGRRVRLSDLDDRLAEAAEAGAEPTDILLLRHVAAGDLAAHADEVVEGYRRAWRGKASARELGSVLEHVAWQCAILDPDDGGPQGGILHKKRRAVHAVLETIHQRLVEMARPAAA